MNIKAFKYNIAILLAFSGTFQVAAETKIRGLVQAQFVAADEQQSYLEHGTGLLRYGDDNKVELAHALLELNTDITDFVKLHAVLNHTQSPESFTNFSQLSLRYKPILAKKYRWQFKAGMFYPQMGFENPDIGWLSPYNYTNSAISSWIGEEMRTIGAEFKVTRLGRLHGSSPHNLSLVGSFFKGNDTAGTILAWRGWGLHDKQSLLNETIPFARYPSIAPGQDLGKQAAWVEPFREIDGRWGYYIGAHWDYRSKSRLRYYYYDNNADELVLARGGQYAWHTSFHSLAWQYRFDKHWRLLSQYLNGTTAMGPKAVIVDYNAWYMMLNYKSGPHLFSARIDDFKTIDKDSLIPIDNNNGDGTALTVSYRYKLNKHWQLGIENIYGQSFQASRAQFAGADTDIDQSQFMAVVQYRF